MCLKPKFRAKRSLSPWRRLRGDASAGYSLLEVLLAGALLAMISVSIIPMFTRALESNSVGGRASVMSTFAGGDLEAANQATIDHPDWDLAPGGVLDLGTEYWNAGLGDTLQGFNRKVGEGEWQDNADGPGLVLWSRRTKVRKYSFADIIPGTISVEGGTDLIPLGHPELFDSPLDDDDAGDANKVHLVEFRVTVKPCRNCDEDDDNPDAVDQATLGQKMTVGHFRSY